MHYNKVEYCFNQGNNEKEVLLRGWVHRLRKQKNDIFLTLRDSSGVIQCVIPTSPAHDKVTIESSVILKGIIKKDQRSPGGYEIHANYLDIIGLSDVYPIQKDFSTEFLNDVRHLWNRSRKMTNIMKVRSEVIKSAREWFDQNGWYETSPPIINRSACEGGATLFELNYFGEKALLSQSAQLYLESLIYSLENVWSLTPSFRAEKSKTPRHLAEFWHLEGEQAWSNFDDLLFVEENLVSHICNAVAERKYQELEQLNCNPDELKQITPPFERIPYREAILFLQRKGSLIREGDDFGSEDEKLLTTDSNKPIFIYGAPKKIKPFYTKINPSDERMVLSADILASRGFGEISTGGQREENLGSIIERIKEEGFEPKDYSWYLDLRKYGSVPHSGFGMGIERLVRWLCKLDHIRDAIPFPRTMKRSYP